MDSTFPFGFPFATGFYYSLLVITFVVHAALMNYVVAGSLYLAGASLQTESSRLTLLNRDWMPVVVSGTITAGIAPLLFIQIVFRREFYTANLLLSWRWMIVIPVLLIAFYLMYVVKSRFGQGLKPGGQTAIAMAIAACIVFIGFCWTSNHLLSISGAEWSSVYLTGQLPFPLSRVVLRMATWLSGSFGAWAIISGWQLFGVCRNPSESDRQQLQFLCWCGLGGVSLSAIVSLVVFNRQDISLFSQPHALYVGIGILGLGLQWIAWLGMRKQGWFDARRLSLGSLGSLLALLAVAVERESIRIRAVDMASLLPTHESALREGGLFVFLLFTVINGALIVWCIRIVSRHSEDKQAETPHE